MTGPSPSAAAAAPGPSAAAAEHPAVAAGSDSAGPRLEGLRGLLPAAAVLCGLLLVLLVLLPGWRSDPYSRTTLSLQGSSGNGGRLFQLNCAGCHGLAAQGLVGPDLHGVVRRKNDRQLIQQVVSGRTPPMPRFQPEPQAMADLIAFLHSLPG